MSLSGAIQDSDFEDNNPFAEPLPLVQGSTDQQAQSALPIPETNNHNSYYSENTEHNSVDNSAHNQEEEVQEDEPVRQLVKEDLMKLLPERFSSKYLITIRLKSIETNKANNPILKFDAAVRGLPRYRQKVYRDVRRTFNEVSKFNQYLIISNLEVFVPVIPSATTSYPAGGEDEKKQWMFNWQEWFDRITLNPILIRDEEFIYFIENDFGYTVINSQKRTSVASGFMRKTLKQLPVPFDPYEDLATFRPLIKSAYLLCQKLAKCLEKDQRHEKQLSANMSELSTKLKGLSHFETTHPGMKNLWEKLSKIVHIHSDLILYQLVGDMISLGDGMNNMANDFYEIKEALTNRYLIMRELIQAETQTKSKHAQATKMKNKSSLDPIRVDEAIRSLEFATQAEENLHKQVKRISGEMMYERKEVLDFTEQRFKRIVKQFTLNRVEQHRRLLKHLEGIRLDVRIVDENGGLSRLNRDNLSQMKHNLTHSQGANGDSWSSRKFRSLNEDQAVKEQRLHGTHTLDSDKVDVKEVASILGTATF